MPGGECSPSGCCNQQRYSHPQAARQLTEVFTLWMMVLLSSSGIILPLKGVPNPGPRDPHTHQHHAHRSTSGHHGSMPVGAYTTRVVEIGRPRISMRGPCHLAGELCQGFNDEVGASAHRTQGARGAGHAPSARDPATRSFTCRRRQRPNGGAVEAWRRSSSTRRGSCILSPPAGMRHPHPPGVAS
jgi:hypothetical protein